MNNELISKISHYRAYLHAIIEDEEDLTGSRVLYLSMKLDELINEFNRCRIDNMNKAGEGYGGCKRIMPHVRK